MFLLAVEEEIELGNQVVIDKSSDFGCGGIEDGAVVHIFLRHVSIDQVEQVLHARKPDIVLVGLENLAHQVRQELARVRLLQLLGERGVAENFLDDLHILTLDLYEVRVVALDIEGVEQTDEALYVLVLFEQLLEDRAVNHVVDYSDIEMFSLRFERRIVLD